MASTRQVRYRLKDYHKEASEKYRQEVSSRGQYLSVPGCDENSLTRNGDQYELLIPLSDYNASELVDPTSLRESLRLYEEKLQFGLDSYNILPNNYEQFSMSTSTEPTIAEIELPESNDDLYTTVSSRTLIESFLNELKPIHFQAEFPAFTESEIYGDMRVKSYESQRTLTTLEIMKFDLDTSQTPNYIETMEYTSCGHKKSLLSLEKLFVPRDFVDPSTHIESRYTDYIGEISFPHDEEVVSEIASLQSTNETDLLDVAVEFNNVPDFEACERFGAIRPVNVVSKFRLKEVNTLDGGFREAEERASYLLQDFEARLWEDEISFHDPTVKPLKIPIIHDDTKRSFLLRDLLRQVHFELVHTMQLELDLKSYWQREGLEKYRASIELDAMEYKFMDVEDNDAQESNLNEVFNPVPGFSLNTLIGDKADVSYVEFQLDKIREENTDEDSRYLKSLKDKTESCIDYNDNCKGLIYNYISMVESLPSIMVFSQVIDDVLPPESAEKSFVHETISRCDTRGGPVTPVANTPTNRSLQYNSPKPTKRSVEQLPASAYRGVQAKQARTPSILEEDPLLEYMKLRGVLVESTLPKSVWDRKYRLTSPPEGSYDEYKTSLAEVIRLSGQSVLLASKSVAMSQVILYLCYNIICVMKAPVIWLCSDEDQSNNVMALVKPILHDAVHLVSKGFAAPTVKPGEPALLVVNEQAVQGVVMKKRYAKGITRSDADKCSTSVLQQLSTAHLLFLDNTVDWEQPTTTAKEFTKLLPVSARVVLYSSVPPSSFQVFLQVIRDLRIESIVSVLKADADVKSGTCLAEKIFVPLSDEIFRVLDVVSAFQQELISQIKETSVIELPEDSVLLSATHTKCLIDQLAQTIKDVPAGQSQGMSAMLVELMKLLVCAYVLAKADGYLVHYGVLSAVHGLASAMQHPKYGKALQDMLRDLHEELLRCQQEIDAGLFQTHPKINVFTRLVSDATSNRKNKCLIIIEHEQLGSEIIVALNRNPETHLEIGTITENMTQSQMLDLIKSNDILIVPVTTLAKNTEFPYSSFSWVIEYEDYGLDISDKVNRATRHVKLITSRDEAVHQSEANERLCEAWIKKLRSSLCSSDKLSEVRAINICEYVTGKMNWPQSLYLGVDLNDFSESSFTADVTATDRPESPSALIPIKLIIGERLLQRRELLSEMQDKQRIELIERTLGFNEDIIIDDKTCVLIRKLSTLPNLVMQPTGAVDQGSKEKEQRKLLIELIKLALKYPSVWLLIEVDDDILQPHYQAALQEIQLWTVYFSNETQIRYGFSVKHLAQLIRRVCHHCAQNSVEWNGSLELWASRKWLLDDESKHEVFLAKFPSMNPFRAQIILTLIELKEALGTSLEELKQKFRWILPSALEYLDYALNYTKVAAIQQTYPSPQRQQAPGVLRGQQLRAPANRLKRTYDAENDTDRNAMKKRKVYAY